MNPFDMTGPGFLLLYVGLLVAGTIGAIGLRWSLRGPGGDAPTNLADHLSAYEIAYLAGSERNAIHAAIVRLLHLGVLRSAVTRGKLVRGNEPLPNQAEPIEKVVAGAVGAGGDIPVDYVSLAASATADQLRVRLVEMGLVVPWVRCNRICLASALMILAIGLFGLAKVFVGVARERPVGFLVALLVLTGGLALLFYLKRPLRSRRGDRALAHLRQEKSAVRSGAGRNATDLKATDLILACGLFGTGVLAGGPLQNMLLVFQKSSSMAPTGTFSSGDSGGGGCGGGIGCGGSGGCGGGGGCGGCGGGCGGCGGG